MVPFKILFRGLSVQGVMGPNRVVDSLLSPADENGLSRKFGEDGQRRAVLSRSPNEGLDAHPSIRQRGDGEPADAVGLVWPCRSPFV